MKKMLTALTLGASVIMGSTGAAAHGFDRDGWHHHERDRGHHHVLKVGLWGDQFYADDLTRRALMAQQTIDSMNTHHLDFTLYAGDSKNGHSECTNQVIGAGRV